MSEEQANGVVPSSVYFRYFKMGGILYFIVTLLVFAFV